MDTPSIDYSQNGEQKIIHAYFKDFKGTCLSIGENDGKTLSNVLACLERGWSGVLIEPSLTAFNKLSELHKGKKHIECFNVAIANQEGFVEFYESGTHLNQGDTSLLSSLKYEETVKWKDETFETTIVQALRLEQVIAISKHKTFDLITIDVEGLDYDVLTQMDLDALECKMLIVESNSIEDQKYIDYCAKFGMKLHDKNYMNLTFIK